MTYFDNNLEEYVVQPTFPPHITEYFSDVCGKVLCKFVSVRDVNMKTVSDIIVGLPNDVYSVCNNAIAKFCYYWLGSRRINVIGKVVHGLQNSMRTWANLSMSVTKNVNSTSFKKMCAVEFQKVPITVLKHYAAKILQLWCKAKTTEKVHYVSPKWMSEHQHILDEYLCSINFDSARCHIGNLTFDRNSLSLYKLYCCGFDVCTIKDQVSMLCCKWSVEMTLKSRDCFEKYNGNVLVVNQTMLDMQLVGFCNVRKQDVRRKYKAWLSLRNVEEVRAC
jgi:hypothetical protein